MVLSVLQRFVRGRALPCLLAGLLAVSMVATCALVPSDLAWAAQAELSVGHKISYGGYDTNAFTVNGFEAYCGDPGSTTPAPGTYDMQPASNPAIAAGLWYGFNGPGFQRSLWPQRNWDDSSMDDDSCRVATHVALAYLASGSADFACGQCDDGFRSWCAQQLFGSGSICERIAAEGFTINGASASADALPAGFTAYVMSTGSDTQVMYAMDYRPRGSFNLKKASARPALSDQNGCYRLDGAVYGVFEDGACTCSVATLTTDANGFARSPELELGTYYVKELAAPAGYAMDDSVHRIDVAAGDNGTLDVSDEPQSNPIDLVLQKIDAETGEPRPSGGATLAGAEYSLAFYAGSFSSAESAESSGEPRRSWTLRTDEEGRLSFESRDEGASDEPFADAQGRPVLPLGTAVIRETKAPAGYLLSEEPVLVPITGEGEAASVETYAPPAHAESIVRGDLAFVKTRETDQQRLANIPFKLTSNTTGEWHILVTDENGQAKTSSAWNPHTQRANANDAALLEDGSIDEAALDADAGLWFGASEPRDDAGALPYDTYALEELPVAANEGLQLVSLPAVTIKRDGCEANLGTIDDQPADGPVPLQPAGEPDAEQPEQPEPHEQRQPSAAAPADQPAPQQSPDPAAAAEQEPARQKLVQTGDGLFLKALPLGALACCIAALALLLAAGKGRPSKRKLYRDRIRSGGTH